MAFAKGNSNVMEWPGSPIIYREAPEWNSLKETAFSYYSEKAALCHYYGTANKTYKLFLTGDQIKYKKYFYALRPLLCCRWIERYHQAPPIKFQTLLRLFSEPEEGLTAELYESIQELMDRKTETIEKDLNPQMPVIIEFIRKECLRQKQISEALPDDRKHDYTELNAAFRRVLGYK